MSLQDRHPFEGARYRDATQAFSLAGRVVLITGAAGLLGRCHAEAVLDAGGVPVINDVHHHAVEVTLDHLRQRYPERPMLGIAADITSAEQVEQMVHRIVAERGRLDALVNNAALNPKMSAAPGDAAAQAAETIAGRFENFSLERWNHELAVGLSGAFLCAQAAGRQMLRQGGGNIVNVSSDLGIIAPDQRIYRKAGVPDHEQPVKPPTYSVIKGGLAMLTRYLATYWAEQNIRVNTLTPASVFDGQDWALVEQVAQRVPMGRMSHRDEFKGALIYLLSDASSYMNGHNLVLDGGRSIW